MYKTYVKCFKLNIDTTIHTKTWTFSSPPQHVPMVWLNSEHVAAKDAWDIHSNI